MSRVVIIGAGISGLALAYRLLQLDPALDLTILEKQPRPGGTMWTERLDGFQVETGPNGFLDNKPSTLNLCRALGLADRLIAASAAAAKNRYLYLNSRLNLLPYSLGSFLLSDLVSWRGKLGILAERFRPARVNTGDESIDAFVRRRLGREAAEVFADALVTGIHAGDPALLSVRATFPRLVALEEEHGGLLKGLKKTARQRRQEAAASGEEYEGGSKMWSFREGLRLLVEALRERLLPRLVVGVQVVRVTREASSTWTVHGEGKDQWPADSVALTCPAYEQSALLADMDRELAEKIGGIAYNRVAVVALGYRRDDIPMNVDGFGYIAPQRTRRDVLGVQWCSAIFPDRAPPGLVLLRAMCGGWHRPEVAGWEDARLLEAIRAELRMAMGIESAPVFHHIVRWERAIPQYLLGHLERVRWIEERVRSYSGLFVAGNAYCGVALNDCTEQAERLAEKIARSRRPC